jgi:hypothetical protein
MPAHSRPKDGVATLAYVAGIHALAAKQGVDGRNKSGHDELCVLAKRTRGPDDDRGGRSG